jgi:hypothetical protein
VTTLATALSGAPGGIFAPSLGRGGLGQLAGTLFPPDYSGAVAMLGMIAYFAGVTRAADRRDHRDGNDRRPRDDPAAVRRRAGGRPRERASLPGKALSRCPTPSASIHPAPKPAAQTRHRQLPLRTDARFFLSLHRPVPMAGDDRHPAHLPDLAGPHAPSEWREMLRLAAPLVGANLLQMAVFAVDVLFVARLGPASLAASSWPSRSSAC